MEDSDILRTWLKEREALSISVIERLSGMPYGTLCKFKNGQIKDVPEKHWPKLKEVIELYGWK